MNNNNDDDDDDIVIIKDIFIFYFAFISFLYVGQVSDNLYYLY